MAHNIEWNCQFGDFHFSLLIFSSFNICGSLHQRNAASKITFRSFLSDLGVHKSTLKYTLKSAFLKHLKIILIRLTKYTIYIRDPQGKIFPDATDLMMISWNQNKKQVWTLLSNRPIMCGGTDEINTCSYIFLGYRKCIHDISFCPDT